MESCTLNAHRQPVPMASYMFLLTGVTATFYFWHKEIQTLLFSSVNMLQHLQLRQFWDISWVCTNIGTWLQIGAALTTIFLEFLCWNDISLTSGCTKALWIIHGHLENYQLAPFPLLLIFITIALMPQSSNKKQTEKVLWTAQKHTRKRTANRSHKSVTCNSDFSGQLLKAATWVITDQLVWCSFTVTAGTVYCLWISRCLQSFSVFRSVMKQKCHSRHSPLFPFSLLPISVTPLVFSCSVLQIYIGELELF